MAAAFVMVTTGPALAGSATGNELLAQNAGQDMGAMQNQMMQQMQQCMDRMGPMNGTDQSAMRPQMMGRMHACMEKHDVYGRSASLRSDAGRPRPGSGRGTQTGPA